MVYFILFFSLIFGLLVGSFLNVVALRFNTGKSLGGRSGCFSCGSQLSWKELFPAFSWLIQRGRCKTCSSKISPMYIRGELTTAIFFGLIALRGFIAKGFLFDPITIEYLISTLYLFFVFSILLVVFFYDVRHKIIPNKLSLIFGIFGFLGLFFLGFDSEIFTYVGLQLPALMQILGGILVPLPFVLLWIISKGKWLGLGDPKLMVGMGFLFGTVQGFSAVFVSFWIGALFAISVMIINKIFHKTLLATGKASIMKEEVPFAPFLIIGTLITLVFNLNFF